MYGVSTPPGRPRDSVRAAPDPSRLGSYQVFPGHTEPRVMLCHSVKPKTKYTHREEEPTDSC